MNSIVDTFEDTLLHIHNPLIITPPQLIITGRGILSLVYFNSFCAAVTGGVELTLYIN